MKVLVQQWWMYGCLVLASVCAVYLCPWSLTCLCPILDVAFTHFEGHQSHLIWQSLDYLGKPWQRGHLLFYAHVLSLLGPTSHQECVSRGTFFGLHGFPPEARELCCESSTGLVMNARHHFSHQAYFLCYSIHHIPWPEWQDCLHHCQDLL